MDECRVNDMYNSFVDYISDLLQKEPHTNHELLLSTLKEVMGEYLFEK